MERLNFATQDIDDAVVRLGNMQPWQRQQFRVAGAILKTAPVDRADGKLIFYERATQVEVITAGPARMFCTCQNGKHLRCVHKLAAEIVEEIERGAGDAVLLVLPDRDRGPAGALMVVEVNQ